MGTESKKLLIGFALALLVIGAMIYTIKQTKRTKFDQRQQVAIDGLMNTRNELNENMAWFVHAISETDYELIEQRPAVVESTIQNNNFLVDQVIIVDSLVKEFYATFPPKQFDYSKVPLPISQRVPAFVWKNYNNRVEFINSCPTTYPKMKHISIY